jgi:hypothetical protein
VNFAGGGNGARLLFDLQWWEALLSDIVSFIAPGPAWRKQRWHSLSGHWFASGDSDNANLVEGELTYHEAPTPREAWDPVAQGG